MAIEFQCPECGRNIRVKEELGGQKGKCPKCGKIIRIPVVDIFPEEAQDIYEKDHYVAVDSVAPVTRRGPEPKTSVLAAFGLLFSILGVTAFLGIVLGVLALKVLSEDPGLKGRNLALAGIIIGAGWLIASPFILMVVVPLIEQYWGT